MKLSFPIPLKRAIANCSKMSTAKTAKRMQVTVTPLPSRSPHPSEPPPAHHATLGNNPTSFKNPWPSFEKHGLLSLFQARFGSSRNFVPVPQGTNGERSDELVKVRTPDWGRGNPDLLKVTWIGHASFLVETPTLAGAKRGVRILFDPVWSDRTSPVGFLGPKRYTPVPCSLDELPDIDIVCISHNHYDHLDYDTIQKLYAKRKGNIHFFVALNNKHWFTQHIHCGAEDVTELDWWDSVGVYVRDVGNVNLTCTPTQHFSGRSPFDMGSTLWCSWALEAITDDEVISKQLYFAGDTAYQHPSAPNPCPVFKEIGEAFGSFDIAMLPIGLMTPAEFMGGVHATPEQSLEIHKEVRAKRSIGMHYGTVRGGLSAQYEDVRDPPRRWREAAQKESLWLGGGVEGKGKPMDTSREGVGLCDVGETIVA